MTSPTAAGASARPTRHCLQIHKTDDAVQSGAVSLGYAKPGQAALQTTI